MFIHFNIATFNDREWANGYEDPATFAPDKLDCGQWADVAKAAKMKYAALTVKHTGGYCLWNSAYTTHDISAFKNFRDGKGDLVEVHIDPALVQSGDTEMVEQLVTAAVQHGLQLAREAAQTEMQGLMGGFDLGGLMGMLGGGRS
jgi:hypothetical protein